MLRNPTALWAPLALLALGAAPAWADTTVYSFTGLYNTSQAGSPVSLGYAGTFEVTDPVLTAVRPPHAPDVSLPAYDAIWSGSSVFYTGATRLRIQFDNSASVSAAVLDTVVNNTTFSGQGAPYPMGQSVQLFTQGAAAFGMTASMVCADGSTDSACDDSDDDPLYREGDASDLAVQRLTGVYFAFWGAPLSTVAAGVPQLANSFGAAGGGLGLYSVNELGQNTTTLTQFKSLSAITTPSAVPEPAQWLLCLMGLVGLSLRGRRG